MKRNSPGCTCCDDACPCHPELWDWEVVLTGGCGWAGTYSFAAASFTQIGLPGTCATWQSVFSLGGGNSASLGIDGTASSSSNLTVTFTIFRDSDLFVHYSAVLTTGACDPVTDEPGTTLGSCPATFTSTP